MNTHLATDASQCMMWVAFTQKNRPSSPAKLRLHHTLLQQHTMGHKKCLDLNLKNINMKDRTYRDVFNINLSIRLLSAGLQTQSLSERWTSHNKTKSLIFKPVFMEIFMSTENWMWYWLLVIITVIIIDKANLIRYADRAMQSRRSKWCSQRELARTTDSSLQAWLTSWLFSF